MRRSGASEAPVAAPPDLEAAPGAAQGLRVALLYHSLVSDWNHGNAHFLRGVAGELLARGARVDVYEPADGWSRRNLVADHGEAALSALRRAYPALSSTTYDPVRVDLDELVGDADLVIVHEWNELELVAALGRHRERARSYRLLFHDTHHRAVTDPESMAAYDLAGYDGVLAFGEVLRRIYLERGWAARAWTWHEAADTRVFRPLRRGDICDHDGGLDDLVWIGNWGDEERSEELHEYLLRPVRALGLRARAYGVRYPAYARRALAAAGIEAGGWLPNHLVPEAFARHRVTMHVPRRPYVRALPGIPTIRPFEALACGIPLVCSPWDDAEGLFSAGHDHLVARDGREMERHLRDVLHDDGLARSLASCGLRTIVERHTCAHRVDELLGVAEELGVRGAGAAPRREAPSAEKGRGSGRCASPSSGRA